MVNKEPISFDEFIKVKNLTDLNPETLTQLEKMINMNNIHNDPDLNNPFGKSNMALLVDNAETLVNQNWVLMKQNDQIINLLKNK